MGLYSLIRAVLWEMILAWGNDILLVKIFLLILSGAKWQLETLRRNCVEKKRKMGTHRLRRKRVRRKNIISAKLRFVVV